jgi:hypothetical protein
MTDNDPAADFEEFLNGQLTSKGARRAVMRDPAYADQQQSPDDPIDHSAVVDTSSPEAAVKSAARKYGLTGSDAELLEGRPAGEVQELAAWIASRLDPNRPRRPQPTPAQGINQVPASRGAGLGGQKQAVNDAVGRSDGRGAWREIY